MEPYESVLFDIKPSKRTAGDYITYLSANGTRDISFDFVHQIVPAALRARFILIARDQGIPFTIDHWDIRRAGYNTKQGKIIRALLRIIETNAIPLLFDVGSFLGCYDFNNNSHSEPEIRIAE